MKRAILASAFVLAAGIMSGGTAQAQEQCPCVTEYNASGTVVKATILGKTTTVARSRVRRPGQDEAEVLDVNIGVGTSILGLGGGVKGHAARSTASAGDGESDASAELADFALVLTGPVNLAVGAILLKSTAHAECTFPESNTSGSSQILGLTANVNGNPVLIDVTGKPNQVVLLAGGIKLILNEQKPVPDAAPETNVTKPHVTVTALRIIVPKIANIAVAESHAAVTCFCKPTS